MKLFGPARLAIATLCVAAAVVVLPSRTASACSCAVADPVVAIARADVVFTGNLVDAEPVGNYGSHFHWTFDVDGVVKGDVEQQQFVTGQEFGGGCGVNFSRFSGPVTASVTVYANRNGGQLESIGCSPTPSATELRSALDAAESEATVMGSGPPSALAIGQTADANLFILGSDGLPLARSQLPVQPSAVAHCAGTAKAVVWSDGPPIEQPDGPSLSGTDNVVSVVDLTTMEIVETRRIESEWVSSRDQLACIDGGDLVVLSRGDGTDSGPVTVATSATSGESATQTFTDVSRAVIHQSGTVAVLPIRPGDPIRILDASSNLAELDVAELGESIAVAGGAFSHDGARFAALVTSLGEPVGYDPGATGLLMLDVVDGVVTSNLADPVSLGASDGRARRVAWLDAEHLIVERETSDSKVFDLITSSGELVMSGDVGWGWGLTAVNGSVLRSRNGGLELVASDLAATPLVPSPGIEYQDGLFVIERIVDAPEFVVRSFAGTAPTWRPFEPDPIDTVQETASEPVGQVASEQIDEPVAQPDDSGNALAPVVIVILGFGGVFAFGLSKIREQRRSGRTSKFPRVG